MGNWAELPEDLLVLTAKRIALFEDFLSFSGVCRSWRSVAINDHFRGSEQIPWLMLSEKDKPDERQFVSLRKGGVIRKINLPEARGKRCLESLGWFVTISEDGDMSLLHPFTRAKINLPHVTTFKYYDLDSLEYICSKKDCMKNHHGFIQKAVLSSCPKESNDYVLVVIYTGCGILAFWRPGDKSWTDVEAGITSFSDVIFHKGLFYGVIRGGMVFAFDPWGSNPTRPWLVLLRGPRMGGTAYIVKSAGVVLMIFPKYESTVIDYEEVDYWVCGFKVFECILGETWVCVDKTSLGDNALFLGDNASISVDASRFPVIKANCIYFTDNFKRRGGSYCMGIYDMEDGSLMRCYEGESSSLIFPPTWVNPSSF
ncbi:hypothetical protein Vadar_020986 [Vaccinium darrowii]|uniref:Uncharacterized protein n=1 Tax=Vaccinium darrowii TaxID=229202 RepID=A0ACB7XJ93_9ERIC|nr:hypothetical protein Vadar_020986 [Vaccinium darrowii]